MSSARRYKIKPFPLTEKDIKKLENAILKFNLNESGLRRFLKVRNAFMIKYGFYCGGLRPKEIYNARVIDIDIKEKRIYIPGENNKLKKQDFVMIPNFMIKPISTYLKQRHRYFPKSEWLFPDENKGIVRRLDRSSFNRIFRKAIKDSGLYRVSWIDDLGNKRANYKPYSIRVGYANLILQKTDDNLIKLKACMRHKNIVSGIPYLRVNDDIKRQQVTESVFNKELIIKI